jgi:hypothetical protein
MLEASRINGVSRLLFSSSACVYAKDYKIEMRVVRFHNVYGPLGTCDGGKERSPAVISRKVALAEDRGEIEVWGDGEQTRSYMLFPQIPNRATAGRSFGRRSSAAISLYVDDCVGADPPNTIAGTKSSLESLASTPASSLEPEGPRTTQSCILTRTQCQSAH